MKSGQPLDYLWWLVSRASGILALVLVSASVVLGLAMAARALGRPQMRRIAMRLHEHIAMTAVAAVLVHGLSLLGDHWLRPGLTGIAVPFALHYRPAFSGAGIIAGYLIALLGPSFYLRRRIGAKRWRRLHPVMLVAWTLALVHTLGTGSDAGRVWLRLVVLTPVPLVVYLTVARLAGGSRRPQLQAVRGASAGQPDAVPAAETRGQARVTRAG